MDASTIDAGDVLIVGAGLAGLFTALQLTTASPQSPHVTVLTASPVGDDTSSSRAQGGIAAAIGPGDTPAAHAADTLAAGAGLVDPAIAHLLAEEATQRVQNLLALGVPFDKDPEGQLVAGLEAAHSHRRIVRVRGDKAGGAIMAALIRAVKKNPHIHLVEGWSACELACSDSGVEGLYAWSETDRTRTLITARATVLATGGAGGLYALTTNPRDARAQGLAIAARAGAVIADPEFVQFHPTAIDAGLDPAPLMTEALRGEGAVLVNDEGYAFMQDAHPKAELAPRDVVARAIASQRHKGNTVYLDARAAVGARFASTFPTVFAYCQRLGLDPAREPVPVAPAAHYHMGGIRVDDQGRTSLPRLWACGEVAATGAHGANRLASNALLEAVVFGARVARDLLHTPPAVSRPGKTARPRISRPGEHHPASVQRLRALMSRHGGVVRCAEGLKTALAEIAALLEGENATSALANPAVAAQIIITAALWRKESRGAHWRSDFPATDPGLAHRTFLTLDPRTGTCRFLDPVHTSKKASA